MSAWIEMIADNDADAELAACLEQARAPSGKVGNVMRVHSLRPHTMLGHLALYQSVLHHDNNQLPLWLLELLGSYTSLLNQCDYSYTNHSANFRDCFVAEKDADEASADAILAALQQRQPEQVLSGKALALLRYVEKLTLHPNAMTAVDIDACRAAGASDGEILEANQVCAYFCYANRLLNGLGVSLAGDHIGYYR